MLFGSSLKLKRVSKSKRALVSTARNGSKDFTVTPGDLKCRQIYSILEKSLSADDDEVPHGGLSLFLPFCKEAARIFSHHVLGYDIMYTQDFASPEEEWGQVCKWIKLNETSCLGGAPGDVSRLTLLYSCFRMINLVDTLDEEVHDHVSQTHTRAYATAAMQMAFIIPRRSLAEKLSNYFWQHATIIKHEEDEDSLWLQSLTWTDPEQEYDIHEIRHTKAWNETMEILSNQNAASSDGLLLSYSAPVVVPVAILSTLHLLDSLRIQFVRLVNLMTTRNNKEVLDTAFLDILMLTDTTHAQSEDDQQRLVHWLAAVGATVEALWKNEEGDAEKYVSTLIQRVPRSVTCRATNVQQSSNLNQLDEITKKAMIHILIGSILLRSDDVERQKQGLIELENAEVLRSAMTIRKKNRDESEGDLEATVMALAEFVVSFIGLGSWIDAMKLKEISSDKEILINEQIRECSLSLRRMIRLPVLSENQQSIVDRLSRVSRFITHHPGDAGSTSDDDEVEEDNTQEESEDLSHHHTLIKRADKAQLILHGLA